MSAMRVTLTGAAGEVGSQVCRVLVERGCAVHAVDRVSRDDLPVKVEVADLLDAEAAERITQDADAVVHLANNPRYVEGKGLRILTENLTMNANVFDAAIVAGVRKILFASSLQVVASIPVLGPDVRPLPPYLPMDERITPNPTNPYALSKALSETMLAGYSRRASISAVALRIPAMITQPKHTYSGRPGDGFSMLLSRDLGELIDAILRADLPGYRVYMPASSRNLSGLSMRQTIERHYPNVPLRHPVEEMDALIDVATITRDTGWRQPER